MKAQCFYIERMEIQHSSLGNSWWAKSNGSAGQLWSADPVLGTSSLNPVCTGIINTSGCLIWTNLNLLSSFDQYCTLKNEVTNLSLSNASHIPNTFFPVNVLTEHLKIKHFKHSSHSHHNGGNKLDLVLVSLDKRM